MNRSVLQLVAPRTALRRLFYVVWPEETLFAAVHDVPEYVDEAVPYFVLLMLLEMVLTAHRNFRVNDTLASLSSGLLLAVSQCALFHPHSPLAQRLPYEYSTCADCSCGRRSSRATCTCSSTGACTSCVRARSRARCSSSASTCSTTGSTGRLTVCLCLSLRV